METRHARLGLKVSGGLRGTAPMLLWPAAPSVLQQGVECQAHAFWDYKTVCNHFVTPPTVSSANTAHVGVMPSTSTPTHSFFSGHTIILHIIIILNEFPPTNECLPFNMKRVLEQDLEDIMIMCCL